MSLPPKVLTAHERTQNRRCQSCEWHVAAMGGHHPDCDRAQTPMRQSS